MNRQERRLVRRILRSTHCPGCGATVDERSHAAEYVKDGRTVEHLLCDACYTEAAGSQEALQAVARRCAFALDTPEGHA
jgi:hypothetical protein